MTIASTAPGSDFKTEYSVLTGIHFQNKCFYYLSNIIRDLIQSKELKKVDRYGIDIYQLSSIPDFDFNIAFQCKGLEERFEKSQFDQCIKSLDALRKSKKKINQYYLLINLKSKYFNLSLRKELAKELKKLEEEGIVKKAQLLEAESFLKFLYTHLINRLSSQVKEANARFSQDFMKVMEQMFYYDNVPFLINNTKFERPTDLILKKVLENRNVNNKNDKKIWFFIISEFGFGKTSLLLNLHLRLSQNDLIGIYIPAALLNKRDFGSASEFSKRILEIIEGTQIDFNDQFNKLRARILLNIFTKEHNKYVLLIDGLDEQESLFDENLLNIFFNNISNIKSKIIFSVRKEMWDERQGNFEIALNKSNPENKVKILLEPWRDSDIISFINYFLSQVSLKVTQKKNILDFKKLILSSGYSEFYGDIPKRPLFLEMIINDVKENKIQERNISEIYEEYLKNKIIRDRTGSFKSLVIKRPLNLEGDLNQKIYSILEILDSIAAKMLLGVDKNNIMVLTNNIEEKKVKDIIKESGIKNLIDLLLNSVLVSSGIRSNNNMELKFAHKSFQEFFTARHIFNFICDNLEKNLPLTDLVFNYSEGISKFLIGLINVYLKEDLKIKLLNHLKSEMPFKSPGSLEANIFRSLTVVNS